MSTEKKLTAVEWLFQEITKKSINEPNHNVVSIFKQAKELEKQQIIDFAKEACYYNTLKNNDFEDIYNETFKN